MYDCGKIFVLRFHNVPYLGQRAPKYEIFGKADGTLLIENPMPHLFGYPDQIARILFQLYQRCNVVCRGMATIPKPPCLTPTVKQIPTRRTIHIAMRCNVGATRSKDGPTVPWDLLMGKRIQQATQAGFGHAQHGIDCVNRVKRPHADDVV